MGEPEECERETPARVGQRAAQASYGKALARGAPDQHVDACWVDADAPEVAHAQRAEVAPEREAVGRAGEAGIKGPVPDPEDLARERLDLRDEQRAPAQRHPRERGDLDPGADGQVTEGGVHAALPNRSGCRAAASIIGRVTANRVALVPSMLSAAAAWAMRIRRTVFTRATW